MLLGQVLEVSLGERDLGSKDELVAWILAIFDEMDWWTAVEVDGNVSSTLESWTPEGCTPAYRQSTRWFDGLRPETHPPS